MRSHEQTHVSVPSTMSLPRAISVPSAITVPSTFILPRAITVPSTFLLPKERTVPRTSGSSLTRSGLTPTLLEREQLEYGLAEEKMRTFLAQGKGINPVKLTKKLMGIESTSYL